MTTIEAKEMISRELIDSFLEYLKDWDEMENFDFGRKYGWQKGKTKPEMNFEGMKHFMNYIFNGRWLPLWVKAGYPRETIIDLCREGWLSEKHYSNWNARATGRTDYYFISQRTAREIWKAYKEESKNA